MPSAADELETRLGEIYHYRRLADNLATAGQPTAAQFSWIAQAGFQVVINLAPATGERALAGEPGIVHALKMQYVHIPVAWTSPLLTDLRAFFDVMEQQAGHSIFAHCTANLRVSAFMALYQTAKYDWPVEKARQEAQQFWEFNPTWHTFFEDAIRSLR